MTEVDRERDHIIRLQEHDLNSILLASKTLKHWFDGDEALTIKQAELAVKMIVQVTKEVLARLDL